ncbi:T9SS type A sorting domain-containing protein [Hymenobacter edaphi]|uniref:Secretion system C-terminal sorting domain-containing protein n=1 Tax=Hymenobacter edaphi TaxID=2211146 RepID=A0A328BF21_9BACT|nr:T9SS type A sorting domain-containing protein [Hymenobacter edaphi]RAK65071.1 hypothetical protein DLM85_16130 [Hymenobacter edaphi]
MNPTILRFAFSALTMAAVVSAQAQTTYTSRAGGGNWSDPNTWTVSGAGPQVPTNVTTRSGNETSDNVIVINSNVVLDQDYNVSGDHAKLIITAGGALTDGASPNALNFGQQQGADMVRLDLDGRLDLNSVSFYKADADIAATAELTTSCNIALANQSDLVIAPGATVDIDGNLVVRQGNPSISGSGTLMISGCVLTNNNGSLNGLFGANLSVCVQGTPNSCATEGLNCSTRIADYITIDACRNTPLPVQLTSFTGKYLSRQVQLDWVTAQEKDADSFTVERSVDGKRFDAVTTVRAAGNSTTRREYSYLDATMRPGLNYYRLKQTDHDGTFTYSQIVPVQAGAGEQALQAYGSGGALTVEMRTDAQCRAFRVMDSMGRLVYTETLPEGATGFVTRQIPLRGNSGNGVYIVQAITSTGTLSKKFFVQE